MTGKRRRLTAAERRAQILEAGLQVFGRKGHEAATLDEVAAVAGVTKPIIYDYFKNKQAFVDAIAEREMEIVGERIATAIDPLSEKPVVEQVLAAFFQYVEERPDGFRALTSHAPIAWSGNDRRSELRRDFYDARVGNAREHLERLGLDGVDADILAHSLIGAAMFVGELWINTRRLPAGEVVRQMTSLFRFGLLGRPPSEC